MKFRNLHLAASALVMGLVLAACGGGDDDNSQPASSSSSSSAPASSAPSSSAPSSSAPSSSSSSSAISSSAPANSSSSSAPTASSSSSSLSSSSSSTAATTKIWGFTDSAYSAAGQTLFTADYSATADNNIKIISSDIATGAISVDGLNFNSTAANVMRYRPAGSTNNATAASIWNTNGSFYTNNQALIPAIGADGSAPANSAKLRTYLGVPVTAAKALDISIEYRQTSTSATAGKLALFCSDNTVLTSQDVFAAAAADGSYNTMTYSAPASHTCTELRIIYGREGATGGGVNIGKITLTQ